jgi:hypothetical protein
MENKELVMNGAGVEEIGFPLPAPILGARSY